jgi:probable rRNA maturation factor
VREAALAALDAVGVVDGHLAIAFVRPEQIAVLNHEHRGTEGPTDVLSFPIDGTDPVVVGPRELGDVIICREHTTDVVEAVVHGRRSVRATASSLARSERWASRRSPS